jgi:signal transduction histidine kinase
LHESESGEEMSIRLKDHIAGGLKSLKFTLVLCAGVASLLAAFLVSIYFSIESDRAAILATRGYLAGLVSASDRPDVLRILDSIARERNRTLTLVSEGFVFADTKNLEILDTAFHGRDGISVLGVRIDGSLFEHTIEISSEPTLFVVVSGNIWPVLSVSFAFAIFVASLIFVLMLLVSRAVQRSVDESLKPLSHLLLDVRRLGEGLEILPEDSKIEVSELQEIRNSIETAGIALQAAQSQLAESRAKDMTARAYQSLIHDLHTPVTALHAWVSLLKEEDWSLTRKEDAVSSIVRVAEQILRQVTAGRKNLEFDDTTLRLSNVVETVESCVAQIRNARSKSKIAIECDLSGRQIHALHDAAALSRAVVNLLENSVDAASSTVRVSLIQMNNAISVRVEDDGPDLRPEEVARFLSGRGDSEKKGRQAFGLSGAAHIARAHSGRIVHRRSDLGGACFEIQLGTR